MCKVKILRVAEDAIHVLVEHATSSNYLSAKNIDTLNAMLGNWWKVVDVYKERCSSKIIYKRR